MPIYFKVIRSYRSSVFETNYSMTYDFILTVVGNFTVFYTAVTCFTANNNAPPMITLIAATMIASITHTSNAETKKEIQKITFYYIIL